MVSGHFALVNSGDLCSPNVPLCTLGGKDCQFRRCSASSVLGPLNQGIMTFLAAQALF